MDLNKLRKKIDVLDSKIVELLNERANVVKEIGVVKNRTNAQVYAPDREIQVYKRVTSNNKGPLSNECIMAVYRELMSGSLILEAKLCFLISGPHGASPAAWKCLQWKNYTKGSKTRTLSWWP